MIESTFATFIIIVFILLFGIGLPVFNVKISEFVSYRWCVVVVVLALLIGAVIDFKVLPEDSRKIVLYGGMIIAGGFVLLRTVEKALANGWLRDVEVEVEKGDAKAKLRSKEAQQQTKQDALTKTNKEDDKEEQK